MNHFQTDFMMERRLAAEAPQLSQIFRNSVTVMDQKLLKTKTLYPLFTDHALRHVTFTIEFCNILVGRENIKK